MTLLRPINYLSTFALVFSICVNASAKKPTQTYQYPFQNPKLSEDARIENLISLMSVEEKIAVLHGMGVPRLGVANPGSTEAIHGIVRGGSTGYPQVTSLIQLANRPEGQAGQMPQNRPQEGPRMINSTCFPQGYGLGQTWDREMLKLMGEVMSNEARYYSQKTGRNVLVLWSPNADLARDPRWGRTEESFGEDPYLVGELSAAEIIGIQGEHPKYWRGAAVMKHFLANSNEDGRCWTDSRFAEDLFHDYYAYGFWKGVSKGGGRSLMCAYNKYNGVPCSTNDFIKDVLFDKWGMDGMILNDGGALDQLVSQHHYAENNKEAVKFSLEAGISRFLGNYTQDCLDALNEGLISEDLINRNIAFNIRTMLRLGLLDNSEENPYKDMTFDSQTAPWEGEEHKNAARLVSQKSIVLLKNEGKVLPLDKSKIKKIAVFGNRAEDVLRDWYGAVPSYFVTPLQGLKNAVKDLDIEIKYQTWDNDGSGQELAKWADVCIVFVGNNPNTSPDWGRNTVQAPWGLGNLPSEGREAVDRRSLQLETEDLIKVIWQANPNTVVSLISSFPYSINWSESHVPAIIHSAQSSQELGNALADVIFGDYNPAGRTTQTWVKDILDLPNMMDYDIRNGRTYMYFKGEALYPFGHGLSYTEFKYSDIRTKSKKGALHISFDLENIGDRDGEEVIQVYFKFAGDDAIKRLRAFERVALKRGESKKIEVVIPEEDLKLWSIEKHDYQTPKGKACIMLGASSVDIRLKTEVNL